MSEISQPKKGEENDEIPIEKPGISHALRVPDFVRLLSKKNYNCQDITGIECVKIGYYKRNVITIAFRDGKKCSITRTEKNFVNLARYLLDQLANGEIASDVIEREHVDRLKKSASGIKW